MWGVGGVGARVGVVQFSLRPGPRSIRNSPTSPASRASAQGQVTALFVKVQSYPAGLHFHTAYINLGQAGFPVSSAKKKSSPLRDSVQMEIICVTGCQFSF